MKEVNVTEASADSRVLPWYREPWPWVLIALPGLVIIGCAITLLLALRSADGMVAADYYKRGLAINAELTRSQRATMLGLRADVAIAGFSRGDRVRVRLTADRALPAEPTLRLSFFHPGRDGADRVILLTRATGDVDHAEYVGQFGEVAEPLRPVAWQVAIESSTWRLDGRISVLEGREFRLDAVP
jgi:hypothetical protein